MYTNIQVAKHISLGFKIFLNILFSLFYCFQPSSTLISLIEHLNVNLQSNLQIKTQDKTSTGNQDSPKYQKNLGYT